MLRNVLFLLVCTIPSALTSYAQMATGTYPFGTFESKGFDTINLGNLNSQFVIPIMSKPGRGLPFQYSLVYESLVWSSLNMDGDAVWTPNLTYGFQEQLNGGAGAITGSLTFSYSSFQCANGLYVSQKNNYTYNDPNGQAHVFDYAVQSYCSDGSGGGPVGTGKALDISGYTLNYPNVLDKSGKIVTPILSTTWGGWNPAPAMVDTNGNFITSNGDGTFVDTLGVTELTITGAGTASSPLSLTYPVVEQAGGATTATAKLYYASYRVKTNFACSGITEYDSGTTTPVSLPDHLTLADGSVYSFAYEPTPGYSGDVTGRLQSVTLPTGGIITYAFSGGCGNGINTDGTPAIMARTTTDGTKTYTRTIDPSDNWSTNTAVDEVGNETDYTFIPIDGIPQVYEYSRAVWSGPATTGNPLEQKNTYYNFAVPWTSVWDSYNGLGTKWTVSTYDSSGNLLSVNVQDPNDSNTYDRLRLSQYTYNTNGNLLTATTYGNNIYQIAYAYWGYDETTPAGTSGIAQHDNGKVTGSRYNQTSAHYWTTGSTYISTTTAYWDTGAVKSITTPNGTTQYSLDTTQAFTTAVTQPTPSSGVTIATSASFDASSGAQLSATGANTGQTITYGQYDPLMRLTQMTTPSSDGGQMNVAYSSNQVSTTVKMNSSQTANQETFLDAYGRTKRTAVRADLPGASVAAWYLTDYCYDPDSRLQYQSTPYASPTDTPMSFQCSSISGDFYQYDGLNRPTYISHADGSYVTFNYNGRAVQTTTSSIPTVTPAVSRITQYDLLGGVLAVCELSSNAAMPNSGSPIGCTYSGTVTAYTNGIQSMDIPGTGFMTNYATNYSYGSPAFGYPFTFVTQGGQTRKFETDGVGRPTYTSEPESGVTTYSYAYNGTGLQVVRTRPKANIAAGTTPIPTTTTTTQYDSLSRPVSITYSDGTPLKTFGYDTYPGIGPLGLSLGKMVYQNTSSGGSLIDQYVFYYDIMGRVNEMGQCLPGWCYPGMGNYRWYSYNSASQVIQEKYDTVQGGGSPATLNYGYDLAGQLSSVSGGQSGGTLYAAQAMSPSGPTSALLGNGLYTPYSYGAMGNITGSSVCNGSQVVGCSGGTQLYGFTATAASGQVTASSDTVLGQQLTYGYDEFNRLSSVATVAGSSTNGTVIGMNFGYDRWGNRVSQTMTQGIGPQPSFTFNPANNQLTSAGFLYDVAGNVKSDGMNTYTYDAENNLIAVNNGSTAAYTYNASGQRTMVVSGGSTERYGFNLQGQRATSWNSSAGLDAAQYYAGSQIAYWSATDSNVHYQHADFIGTVRARTNSLANVEGTYFSLPFGDAAAITFGNDTDAQHFAQLDHDGITSSGLEHASAREYHSTSGRWLSPDSYSGSYNGNPQSLNRYVYAMNNPLLLNDPLGLDPDCQGVDQQVITSGPIAANDRACLSGGQDPDDGGGTDPNPNPDPGLGDPGNVPPVQVPGETVNVTASISIYDFQIGLNQMFGSSIYIAPNPFTLLASNDNPAIGNAPNNVTPMEAPYGVYCTKWGCHPNPPPDSCSTTKKKAAVGTATSVALRGGALVPTPASPELGAASVLAAGYAAFQGLVLAFGGCTP